MNQHIIAPRFTQSVLRTAPSRFRAAQQPFIATVRTKLETGAYRFEATRCPCGTDASSITIAAIDRYGLPLTSVLCTACGTIRFDPYLDSASLQDFYRQYYQQMYGRSDDVDAYFAKQRAYGQRLLQAYAASLAPHTTVVEIGCGAGGALAEFHARGFQVAGCDYSAELIDAGGERGVTGMVVGDVAALQAKHPVLKANLVLLHHVFEHVEDPLEVLRACAAIVAPEGRIVIAVPNVDAIDRFVYPAGDLLEFLHIAHKYNFTRDGISAVAAQAGFASVEPPAQLLRLSARLVAPELWVELQRADTSHGSARPALLQGSGAARLHYLRRTERLHALGLCVGQFRYRLQWLTPAGVLRRLRSK